MVNYQNGKIYAIRSHKGDKVYVGSTTKKYLSSRMSSHNGDFKQWSLGKKSGCCSSRELFNEYGVENCYIELLELFPCNSREELNTRENHFIRTLNCVNKNKASIPSEERAEYFLKYRQAHKEEKPSYQPNQHSKCKKGYYLNKRANKYIASVQIDEEAIILGAFDTEEEAREAYFEAIEKYLLPP